MCFSLLILLSVEGLGWFPVIFAVVNSGVIKNLSCLFKMYFWNRFLQVGLLTQRINTLYNFLMYVKLLQSCLTLCDAMDSRFLCPRDPPGRNTGLGCHALLQGIILTQGLNPWVSYVSWIGKSVLYH